MDIKTSDIFETVDKHIHPERLKAKLPNLLDIMANGIGTPMMVDMPAAEEPGAMGNPAEMQNNFDNAMSMNVKPEPVDPNLFKFQGRA